MSHSTAENVSARVTWRTAALTVAAMAALFLLRRPSAALHPQFYAEDGVVFWADNYHYGAAALTREYGGYLHLAPRLLAWVSGHFDPAWAPALYFTGALFSHLAVIVALFSPRLQLPAKWALGMALGLVPHTGEVFTNITNIQWPLALGLLLLALAQDATTTGQRLADWLGAVLLGLTGPFSIFLLPVFAFRAVYRRTIDSWLLFILVAGAASVQSLNLIAGRTPINGADPSPVQLASVMSYRLWATLVAGFTLPPATVYWTWSALGGLATVGFALLCLRRGPLRYERACLGMAWTALALAVAVKFVKEPNVITSADNGDRYFYLPHVLVLWLLIWEATLARPRWRWLPASLLLFAVGMGYSRFVEPPRPLRPWASELQPVREGKPFTIPTLPEGWTIRSNGRSRH
ncbi:MAG: hypothetical protein PHQ04_02145 [Opitutaceae bacterium]|nr:hypothetical protein [Opitutaceae bacterium]